MEDSPDHSKVMRVLKKEVPPKLAFINDTTQLKIENQQRWIGGRPAGPKNDPVQTVTWVEALENTVTLELPKGSGALGHHVALEVQTEVLGNASRTTVGGKITALDHQGTRDRITFQLSEYDPSEWHLLLETLKRKQEKITQLFFTLRGLR